ncbi:hypothetical protein F4804DRAFT_335252 [Jackrogersella minutella]|nr:hypothetical protein F4804DRAFT_335252 [Jackrogersella minutella]
MGDSSSREPKLEGSRQQLEQSALQNATRPSRKRLNTIEVYTRITEERREEGESTLSADQGRTIPAVWGYADDGASSRGQVIPVGPAPRSRDFDNRINEWMQATNADSRAAFTGQTGATSGAPARVDHNSYPGVDPNMRAPSVAPSCYSGRSLPSRPASPERPPAIPQTSEGAEPIVLYPANYVPPRKQWEQDRTDQVTTVARSDRRRAGGRMREQKLNR